MSKKTILILSIGGVLIIGGTIAFFKWFKPMIDKKREEKRLAETKVIQKAQTTPAATVTETAVDEMVKKNDAEGPGFGETAK